MTGTGRRTAAVVVGAATGVALAAGIVVATPAFPGFAGAVETSQSAPPEVRDARLQERAVDGSLAATIDGLLRQTEPRWVGWSVPIVDGRRRICCVFDGCCGHCCLEGRRHGMSIREGDGAGAASGALAAGNRVLLEGRPGLLVLARLEGGRIDRVRAVTGDCRLDAGGLPFVWLRDVDPADSVAFLATLAWGGPWDSTAPERTGVGTIAEEAAMGALAALAHHRGRAAADALIRAAREVPSADVRGQALFWLSQRAGEVAAAAIDDAIREDPDVEVKERAVFALSQLPPDEGVPLLIRVARTQRSRRLRKRAIFWLGQSGDPRALAFFQEVLEGAGRGGGGGD